MNEFTRLIASLNRDQKRTGTDYTGTVTKVDGGTAYVRLTGSQISDTPCALTISAKVGDRVRVRVSGGRAWVTGNDTAPPTNDVENIATVKAENSALEARLSALEQAFFGEMKFHISTIGAMTVGAQSSREAIRTWGSEYFRDVPTVFAGVTAAGAPATGYVSATVSSVDLGGCIITVTNTHPTQPCTLRLDVIAFGYRR
jgi:hypothetical protein